MGTVSPLARGLFTDEPLIINSGSWITLAFGWNIGIFPADEIDTGIQEAYDWVANGELTVYYDGDLLPITVDSFTHLVINDAGQDDAGVDHYSIAIFLAFYLPPQSVGEHAVDVIYYVGQWDFTFEMDSSFIVQPGHKNKTK